MFKKIMVIFIAAIAAVVGAIGLVKNSKKMRIRRMAKRMSLAFYNIGTMLRVISMREMPT